MSTLPLEIVVVLDLFADAFPLDAALAVLSTSPLRREIVRSSEWNAPRFAPDATVPASAWAAWTRMVSALVARVREVADGREFHLVVTGNARLPVFFALGRLMERRIATRQTFVNLPKNGRPQVFALRTLDDAAAGHGPVLAERAGLDLPTPHRGNGTLALAFWSRFEVLDDQVGRYFDLDDGALAGIVSAGTRDFLSPDSFDLCERDVAAIARDAHRLYPKRRDVAVFVSGPAPLAFLVGQALNPQVFPVVDVPNFAAGGYEPAVRFPLRPSATTPVYTADDKLAHLQTLNDLVAGIDGLKRDLATASALAASERLHIDALRTRLDALVLPTEPSEAAFYLGDVEGRFEVGRGLLHAAATLPRDERRRFGQMLVLHELYHVVQKLFSTTYQGIGRAGIVLEEIDVRADLYAIEVLTRLHLARGGDRAREGLGAFVASLADSLLQGIECFDRAEQGATLRDLYERRLRRYLLWHLFAACAATLRNEGDLPKFFERRLFVELAPLRGHLDERFDKRVDGATADTELFVVSGDALVRVPGQQRLSMTALLEDVRSYRRDALRRTMDLVRDEHRRELVPWA